MPGQAAEDSLWKMTAESTLPENQDNNGNTQSFDGFPVFEPDFTVNDSSRKQQFEISNGQASQFQRGISRRCLQFDEFQSPSIYSSSDLSSSGNNMPSLGSPAYIDHVESSDSARVGTILSSRIKQASKPLGIGLHLNSIANTLPVGRSATVSIKPTGTSDLLVDDENHYRELSNFIVEMPNAGKDWQTEGKAPPETSSAICGPVFSGESLNMTQQHDHHKMSQNKRRFDPELADNSKESNQSSTNKKRKKSSHIEGDAGKGCSCKKSKCVKLYCECFTAGLYCGKDCACRDCLNSSDCEDTVRVAREQIESRNPAAFAPKIVWHVTEFNEEDGNHSTPIPARHKAGCNCKKSKCLKKYCDCYQANVGCSPGCRCEGCQNVYGKKEEYGMTEEQRSKIEQLDHTADDRLEMTPVSKDFNRVELYDPHQLTPITPTLESSSRGQGGMRTLGAGRYVLTPDSDFSTLPYSAISRSSPISNDQGQGRINSERSKENMDAVIPETEYSIAAMMMMDQLSPTCNTLVDIPGLNPVPNPASLPMGFSVASSKSTAGENVSCPQSSPQSGRLSVFPDSSLRWPITPMDMSIETANLEQGYQSGLHNTEAFVPSLPSVEVTSPNKKRVSPHGNLIHHSRSNSSGNMQSTRRFIIRSLLSTPSVTPRTDSNLHQQEPLAN